jgi:DNA-directed RNA polymerase subunit RPC12/RpoP
MIPQATHCATCGHEFTRGETKTLGHATPLRHGGRSMASNYQVECTKCNYGWNNRRFI